MANPRRAVIAALLLMLAPAAVYADGRRDFTSYGPGTAEAGYGGAATAFANDLSAFYYNPALLASFSQGSVSAAHFVLFDGAGYNFFALGYPVTAGYIAFSLTQLLSGDIESRQFVEDEPTVVHTGQYAFTASMGGPLGVLGLDAGANLHYYYMSLAQYTASAFGVDAGLARNFNGPSVLGNPSYAALGLNIRNLVSPSVKFIEDEDRYPPVVALGASLRIPLSYRYDPRNQDFSYDRLTIAADIEHNTDIGETTLRPGVEYGYLNKYFARLGFRDNVTFSLGIRTEEYQVDYALDPKPYTVMHRLGVAYYWGEAKEPPEREQYARLKEAKDAAKRLYLQQCVECRRMVQDGEYTPAIAALKRAAFLDPGDDRAALLLAKAETSRLAAQQEGLRRAIEEKSGAGDFAGAYRAALDGMYAAGDDACREDAWRRAKQIYIEAAASGPAFISSLDAVRREYAAKLDFDTAKAAINDDFLKAERCLAQLRLLDPGSAAAAEKARMIEERRGKYVAGALAQIEDSLSRSEAGEAYPIALKVLRLAPDNAEAQVAKQRLEGEILAEYSPVPQDLIRCDELYYEAAYAFVRGDTPAANDHLTALFSVNPVYERGVKLRDFMLQEGY